MNTSNLRRYNRYRIMFFASFVAVLSFFPPSASSMEPSSTEPEPIAPPKPHGDPLCPCLTPEQHASNKVTKHKNFDFDVTLGPLINASTYGIGCSTHDTNSLVCLNAPNKEHCESTIPLPKDCDQAWCRRSFCYVDPGNCDLLHRPSLYYRNRYYSYATCGYMDVWTASTRLNSLRGDTLRVAYNSNTGGWKGAHNPHGSFAINQVWRGPIVEFLNNAAFRGGFTINITAPPEWLRPGSQRFFGPSSFDFCVYAASLGYVDVCIAAYSITDKRAAVTTFFETSDDSIYLVTFTDTGEQTSWSSFWDEFGKIFAPFTAEAWAMIVLFSLPLLGLLMMYHEYGSPGSAYPRTAPYLATDPVTRQETIRIRKIPKVNYVGRSLYMAALSFFQESYDQSVITTGGKIHLLAISSLVYLVLAVYTANLAAILTGENLKAPVDSIDAAIQAGFNICSERKVMEMVLNRYEVDPSLIVPDPPELGGDGKPGFTCSNCKSRTRVFDMMRRTHSDSSLYCNAAFASQEDLEALNANGLHCDKIRVGEAIARGSVGIPLYDGISDGLTALLHDMKNDGLLNKEYGFYEPSNTCPETGGEGSSLTVSQLTGIWVISFSFAVAALIVKFITSCSNKRKKGPRYRALYRHDQWGTPCENVVINGKRFDLSTHDFVELSSNRNLSAKRANRSIENGGAPEQYYDANSSELRLSPESESSDEFANASTLPA